MGFDNLFGNGKTQPGVTAVLLLRHREEFFKDMRQVFFRNARTRILNDKADHAFLGSGRHTHFAACGGVFKRIAEQIFKYIPDAKLVGHHRRRIQRYIDLEGNPAIQKSGSHRINRRQHQLFGSNGMKLHPGLPRFHPADIEQIFNDPVKPVAVLSGRGQNFRLFGRQRTKLLAQQHMHRQANGG